MTTPRQQSRPLDEQIVQQQRALAPDVAVEQDSLPQTLWQRVRALLWRDA